MVGAALAAAGVTLVAVALTVWTPHVHDALLILGGLLAIGGGIELATGCVLRGQQRYRKPLDDAYEEGHELGYSKGWRECARENVRPVTGLRDEKRRQA